MDHFATWWSFRRNPGAGVEMQLPAPASDVHPSSRALHSACLNHRINSCSGPKSSVEPSGNSRANVSMMSLWLGVCLLPRACRTRFASSMARCRAFPIAEWNTSISLVRHSLGQTAPHLKRLTEEACFELGVMALRQVRRLPTIAWTFLWSAARRRRDPISPSSFSSPADGGSDNSRQVGPVCVEAMDVPFR